MRTAGRDDPVCLVTRGYGVGAHVRLRTRMDAQAVPIRLPGRDALLVHAAEAVDLLYDQTRTRHGAMPALVRRTLIGNACVHSLDGDDHRHHTRTRIDVIDKDAQVGRSSDTPDAAVAEQVHSTQDALGLPTPHPRERPRRDPYG